MGFIAFGFRRIFVGTFRPNSYKIQIFTLCHFNLACFIFGWKKGTPILPIHGRSLPKPPLANDDLPHHTIVAIIHHHHSRFTPALSPLLAFLPTVAATHGHLSFFTPTLSGLPSPVTSTPPLAFTSVDFRSIDTTSSHRWFAPPHNHCCNTPPQQPPHVGVVSIAGVSPHYCYDTLSSEPLHVGTVSVVVSVYFQTTTCFHLRWF